MSLQRSTRARRLIVAFLVVVALAVAVRFARASATEAGRTSAHGLPALLRTAPAQFDASIPSPHTMGLLP